MKARLWVLLVAVSFLVAQGDAAQCCLPANFKAHYDYLGNISPIVAYRADMLYSETYGLRYDCQLWDPQAHLRFSVYFLQEVSVRPKNAKSNSLNVGTEILSVQRYLRGLLPFYLPWMLLEILCRRKLSVEVAWYLNIW